MTISPIRSGSPLAQAAEQDGPNPSIPAGSRRRAAPDPQTPAALRRRTSGDFTQDARQATAEPTPRRAGADSLASVSHFSDFEHWASALSPAPCASDSLLSLPSAMSGGGLGAVLPRVTGPAASGSRSTADASSDDEALIDDASSSPIPGEHHPEEVRPDDVSTIETMTQYLLQVAAGASIQHLAKSERSGRFRRAFDARGQLFQDNSHPDTTRMKARLDRLAAGSGAHRDVVRRFNAASHQAGKRFWSETVNDMRAVRHACKKLQAHPRPKKKDIEDQVARCHGEKARALVKMGIFSDGTFKGKAHKNPNADGLRGRIELLRTHAGDRYPIALEKWRAFEEAQAPVAEAAAAHKKNRGPISRPVVYTDDVRKTQQIVEQLRRLAAMEPGGSVSRFIGEIKNNYLGRLIDREGGLKPVGQALVERLRNSEPALAQSLVDHSDAAVAASRERIATLLRRLTGALLEVKESGGSLRQMANAMKPVTPFDHDLQTAAANYFNAAGTQIREAFTTLFPAKIARLEQDATPEQLQVIADFRAALGRAHPYQEQLAAGRLHRVRHTTTPGTRAADVRPQAAATGAVAASPTDPSSPGRFSLPPFWPAATPFDMDLEPIEADGQDDDYDLSDLPSADFIDLPPLPDGPADAEAGPSAQAEAGSSRPHDAAWLQQALRHVPPDEREHLINEVALLDGHLASMAWGHVDDLLRHSPDLLMFIGDGRFAATVQRLRDLGVQP